MSQSESMILKPTRLRQHTPWLLALFTCLSFTHAQQSAVLTANNAANSPAQQAKHYVVMVSLDGFRYDYAKKYDAKNLLQMVARGASAPEGMIPSYPSLTFPNHY